MSGRNKFKLPIFGLLILGFLLGFLTFGHTADKPIIMKIGNPGPGHPHKHFIAAASLEFKDYVERHTKGGIKVESVDELVDKLKNEAKVI